MNPALQPFLTVALPIMVTILAAMWANNSRLTDLRMDSHNSLAAFREDVNRQFGGVDRQFSGTEGRFQEVISRLDRIGRKLDNHEERLVRLEERTSLLRY